MTPGLGELITTGQKVFSTFSPSVPAVTVRRLSVSLGVLFHLSLTSDFPLTLTNAICFTFAFQQCKHSCILHNAACTTLVPKVGRLPPVSCSSLCPLSAASVCPRVKGNMAFCLPDKFWRLLLQLLGSVLPSSGLLCAMVCLPWFLILRPSWFYSGSASCSSSWYS